jgi:hypothetical protein
MAGRRATLVAILGVILAACTAGAEPSPAQRASPTASQATPSPAVVTPSPAAVTPSPALVTASPTVAPTPAATSTPITAPEPTPTSSPEPKPHPPSAIKPGDVVETIVKNVRVRSEPRVADSSYKYEPLLPAGTKLYVLDGPVEGSGYEWFWVAQLSSNELPSGWVAAAGRDGEAWLGKSAFDCPAVPDEFGELLRLPRGVGVACFSRLPITFKARLFACNCDVDAWPPLSPGWLWTVGQGPFIVSPSAVRLTSTEGAYGQHYRGLELVLDPEGRYPAKLPIGRYLEGTEWTVPPVVRITGVFDHPTAQTCTWDSHDPVPSSSLPLDPAVGTCRLEFAVTRIAVVQ